MQSLLADRFKLALHSETRQEPFYAMILASPGKTGPKLRPYADDPPCPSATTPSRDFPPNTLEIPATLPCGGVQGQMLQGQNVSAHLHLMARGLTLPVLASYIEFFGQLDHPALDQTGLGGTFDLTIDYLPQQASGASADSADSSAVPLVTALKEQLGLKLESQKGPVDVLVIDHVEEPSPN